jgi:hypothetical protein
MPRSSPFAAGDRVYDRRDPKRSPGTCVELRRHRNGSPRWLVSWDAESMRIWTWESDLRPLGAESRERATP